MIEGIYLAPGVMLNGRYRVRKMLGQGGFGITYDAQDSDGSRVAIKEYFPQELVARQADGSVVPYEQYRQAFYKFLDDFRREAEALRERRMVGATGIEPVTPTMST